jgi:IPT/TIG domain
MSQKPVQRSNMQSGTKSVLVAIALASTLLPAAFGQTRLQPPPPTTPSQAVPPVVSNKSGTAPAKAAPAKADEPVLVQTASKAIVSTDASKWQTFSDYINLKPGQDSMPLTLTFANGDGGPPFQRTRIVLAGNVLGSDQDFKDNKLTKDMTRAIGPGSTRMIIQAFGPVGAKMTWKLTTSSLGITSVVPDSFGPADVPVVKGKGFGPGAKVFIGKKAITVKSASAGELRLSLPEDLEGGKQDLIVQVGTSRTAPYKVTVKQTPQLSSINLISAPPGQTITLSGKNFSTTASDNVVTFSGPTGTGTGAVSGATPTALTVVVPELQFPTTVQVGVKTNGIESKEKLNIDISQRVIENGQSVSF